MVGGSFSSITYNQDAHLALSHFLTTRADPYMNGDILVPFRH